MFKTVPTFTVTAPPAAGAASTAGAAEIGVAAAAGAAGAGAEGAGAEGSADGILMELISSPSSAKIAINSPI